MALTCSSLQEAQCERFTLLENFPLRDLESSGATARATAGEGPPERRPLGGGGHYEAPRRPQTSAKVLSGSPERLPAFVKEPNRTEAIDYVERVKSPETGLSTPRRIRALRA